MRKFLGVLTLSLSATAVAYAAPSPPVQPTTQLSASQQQAIDGWVDQFGEQFENWWYSNIGSLFGLTDPDSGNGGGVVAAPEFDPAGAMAALTLLAGGLAVIRGRRSKKQ